MQRTTDPVALNQWIPCTHIDALLPGETLDTVVLGQNIRVARGADGAHGVFELDAQGQPGKERPVQEKFTLVFTTLGDDPRPLPLIPEFDEPDRRIANSGAVGVHTSPFRLVENFLDMAHFPFVHTDILGTTDEPEVLSYKCEHRKDVDEVWATECTFYQPAASASAGAQGVGQLTHYKYRVMSPFSVMLYKTCYDQPDRDDAIAVFIQPVEETRLLAYMPMALIDDQLSDSELVGFQQTIFLQDRIILENQRPRLLSLAPNAEIPTKADMSSIAFRRWLKSSGITFGLQKAA